jgi:hypothetical protein
MSMVALSSSCALLTLSLGLRFSESDVVDGARSRHRVP